MPQWQRPPGVEGAQGTESLTEASRATGTTTTGPARPSSSGPRRVSGRPIQPGGYPGSAGEHEPGDPPGEAVRLFRKYIHLENDRDYAGIEELFHPNEFVCHPWFGKAPIKPEAETRMLKGLFRSFPDWQMEINEIIYGDDEVCVGKITGRGTQVQTWMNRSPSDEQIAIPLIHCINVRDGRIVRYTSTVPWRDPFTSDYVSSEDIQHAEATQGHESGRTERALQAAVAGGVIDREGLTFLKEEAETDIGQCQALLESNMRRCTKQAATGTIYCEWHVQHGYGVDGPDEQTVRR